MATIVDVLLKNFDVTTALVCGVVLLLFYRFREPKGLPPGPLNLPILGAIPFIRGPPEELAQNVCKKYGPVTRFFLGSWEFVAVGNYEATKDSFIKQGDNFTGKPQMGLTPGQEDTGIGFMEGDSWKAHRRFILSTFRDFGMGKLSLEPKITEEIQAFLDDLCRLKEQPTNWAKLMGVSVSNVICAMEFGSRFDYEDPEFLTLRELLDGSQTISKSILLKMCFPWMKYIPFFHTLIGWHQLVKGLNDLDRFFQKKMDEHKMVYEAGSRRDLIDAFFTERNTLMEKTGKIDDYEDKVLRATLGFLFIAGSESIVATMKWALAILLTYPDIMRKVRKEIDDTIGMERTPSLTDRTKMVYTEAFLNEVHRYASVAPTVMHSNMNATTIMGYRIPKGCLVQCTLKDIHFDPLLWKDPQIFRPERFLDEEGKLKKPEHFLAFGVGKRNCIGESLARMELFLYLTFMLQRFDFHLPGSESVSLDKVVVTITRSPKSFNLIFSERKA